MAGDWIKIEHATPDKPEVWEMAQHLGLEVDAVMGKLVRAWVWMDQNCNADGVTSVTILYAIDRLTAVTGFGQAMVDTGWLVMEQDKTVVPNFSRHNGQPAKSRALTNRRVKESRKRKCNDGSVTNALPEKRREEIVHTPKSKTPDLAKALEFARAEWGTEKRVKEVVELWHAHRESVAWIAGNGKDVSKTWQADLKVWFLKDRDNSTPKKNGNKNSGRANRNVGTLNDRENVYAQFGD